jgi:hypothetical protein
MPARHNALSGLSLGSGFAYHAANFACSSDVHIMPWGSGAVRFGIGGLFIVGIFRSLALEGKAAPMPFHTNQES